MLPCRSLPPMHKSTSIEVYVASIENMMNTFFEHCKMFYDEGIFGAAFEKYYRDLDESEAT